MKNFIILCLLCVIFLFSATTVGTVYAFQPEQIEFVYSGKIFNYSLEHNIKKSNIFNVNHEINKYNRFGSTDERIQLLTKMLKLGFNEDVSLDYLFPNLSNKIDSIAKNVYVAPKNSKLSIDSNSQKVFHITPEIIGTELDKPKLIKNIIHSYLNQKEMKFSLPIKHLNPTVLKKDFEKFTNLRADFSTNISNSNADRKHNIKNALQSLNKVEIAPNQIFSFNNTVGRRTAENGYRSAKIIINNEFVDGIGGGVCQVSSTLYNTALLAGLEIVEANKHSKQVGYVKQGFDAMVNFGSSDLKFKNNTGEKLTIITNYSSTSARIRIFGENMQGTHYKLTNEILNIVNPIEEIIVDENQKYKDKVMYCDEFFYLKTSGIGMEIKSYREKYVNNQLVLTELLRHDKFKVQNAIKIYGSAPRNTNSQDFKNEKSAEHSCA